MTTSMHRLQISLPEQQFGYLAARARREGVSMAEVIRRLLEDAAEGESGRGAATEGASITEARPVYRAAAQPLPAELTLHLPADLEQRLHWAASLARKPAAVVAQEWLAERLATEPAPPLDERERVTQVLRAAGLLAELGPELRARADPTISLEEVCTALDRAGGKPLSEIILEQRGPKA